MQWYNRLYIGGGLSRNSDKIISKIKKNKIVNDTYVITLPLNNLNMFDIYNANELLQNYYKSKDMAIIGIAKGKDEAIVLIQEMISDVYKETGDYNIREYFEKKIITK